jgi:hypothetical protein
MRAAARAAVMAAASLLAAYCIATWTAPLWAVLVAWILAAVASVPLGPRPGEAGGALSSAFTAVLVTATVAGCVSYSWAA